MTDHDFSRWRPHPWHGLELGTDAPDEFRRATFRGQHSGEEKKITGLDRFRVGAERLGRSREFEAKLPQTLLGAGRIDIVYHLPMCAPPSTCNTSPVI